MQKIDGTSTPKLSLYYVIHNVLNPSKTVKQLQIIFPIIKSFYSQFVPILWRNPSLNIDEDNTLEKGDINMTHKKIS